MKSSRYTPAPASSRGVHSRQRSGAPPELSLAVLLEKLLSGLKRLLVAVHYQLRQALPGGRSLPWFKIAIALVLLWMAFKRDMQFQVNLKRPGAESSVLPGEVSREGPGFLVSQSSHQQGFGAGLLGSRDPFADAPGDTGEDRLNKA